MTLYWPVLEEYNGGKIRIRVKGEKHANEGYTLISTDIDYKKYQYSFSWFDVAYEFNENKGIKISGGLHGESWIFWAR